MQQKDPGKDPLAEKLLETDLSSLNVSTDILYAGTFLSFLQGS